jgi:hypothetical protein
LLYAQVKQADNNDYRNILLDDRPLDWRIQIESEKEVNVFEKYTSDELQLLNKITVKTLKGQTTVSPTGNFFKLVDFTKKNKSSTKYGTTVWSNKEVSQLLSVYGLPKDASLSIVVVETLPQINNIFEHMTGLNQLQVAQSAANLVGDDQKQTFFREYNKRFHARSSAFAPDIPQKPSPVSDELGHHRILRTSRLTKVPDVCCTDC